MYGAGTALYGDLGTTGGNRHHEEVKVDSMCWDVPDALQQAGIQKVFAGPYTSFIVSNGTI